MWKSHPFSWIQFTKQKCLKTFLSIPWSWQWRPMILKGILYGKKEWLWLINWIMGFKNCSKGRAREICPVLGMWKNTVFREVLPPSRRWMCGGVWARDPPAADCWVVLFWSDFSLCCDKHQPWNRKPQGKQANLYLQGKGRTGLRITRFYVHNAFIKRMRQLLCTPEQVGE